MESHFTTHITGDGDPFEIGAIEKLNQNFSSELVAVEDEVLEHLAASEFWWNLAIEVVEPGHQMLEVRQFAELWRNQVFQVVFAYIDRPKMGAIRELCVLGSCR